MNNLDEMEEMTNVLLENRYDLHENQNTKKNNNNKKTKKKKGFKHKLKILDRQGKLFPLPWLQYAPLSLKYS